MSLVSIAMATFNGAKFIRQQLASLADQTCLPSELVVSDDGSTDDTLELVRAFAQTAPFDVRILEPGPRLNFADNFLRAAYACRSEFCAFCDQDDVWLDEKIDVMLRRLDDDRSICALHRLTLTNDTLIPYDEWEQGIEGDRVYEPLTLPRYLHAWGNSIMFRRDLIDIMDNSRRSPQPGAPERPLSHDLWVYNIATSVGRVSHIARPLALYRQHVTNSLGAERRSVTPLARLISLIHVPLQTFREQEAFSEAMALGFRSYSERVGVRYHIESARAAEEYGRLASVMRARQHLYESKTFHRRREALAKLRQLEGAPGHGARIKQSILGVAGLNPAVRRLIAGIAPSERV